MHRARLTAAPFAVVVALSSLVIAMGCGGEDDPVAVAQDDLTPSVEVDPWSGVWAIVSVGGANPSVTEHGEIAAIDPGDDVRFIASIAFTPAVKRYSIQMEWDIRAADGVAKRDNTTSGYDQTGTYERTDSTYTLTPAETQGTARLSATARADGGIVANTAWFEGRAQRWVVQGLQTGAWSLEGSVLTLRGDGAATWIVKKR